MSRKVQKRNPKRTFDKYAYYRDSVQSAETDVAFFRKVYRELKGKEPQVLREDFCGTFSLSCEWVKLRPKYQAVGMDLDPEPLEYGKTNYLPKLSETQQARLKLIEGNVLTSSLPKADIGVAMNFSYFVFRTREQMKTYFLNARKACKPGGIFMVDVFGGTECYDENEEVTVHKKFSYYWHQASYDPVTNKALFHIHFRPKGQKKIERVFTYDWRLWSIPEIRDLLQEAGFQRTHVYWEGTTRKGTGDGKFARTNKGEPCDSWIAYIAAEA